VRIDGRAFSKITRVLKDTSFKEQGLPYSISFKRAMILTAHDLLHEFGASTAYTHSDEITLVFCVNKTANGNIVNHMFNGRKTKILTLIAGFASSTFTEHLRKELATESSDIFSPYQHVNLSLVTPNKCPTVPTFDARLIVFPSKKTYEIVNHMMWRSKGDCVRNFVSMYAEKICVSKFPTNPI
jgi:tRNA(His) 5'-end guanylyltransferase